METLIAVTHIIVAIVLIGLVLIQDSKGGSLGGAFGGGGSNTLLGATGATTLAQKATRWTAAIFAFTCIALTMVANRAHKSVLDGAATTPITTPAGPVSNPTPINNNNNPVNTASPDSNKAIPEGEATNSATEPAPTEPAPAKDNNQSQQ